MYRTVDILGHDGQRLTTVRASFWKRTYDSGRIEWGGTMLPGSGLPSRVSGACLLRFEDGSTVDVEVENHLGARGPRGWRSEVTFMGNAAPPAGL